MTTPLRHRRRAERFAQLLDEADGGRRQHLRTPLDEELSGLVSLRSQLVTTTAMPEIDPEFRAGLRAMLVATAEREGIGATAEPEPAKPAVSAGPVARPVRVPRARTAVIAGVAVGAVAFAGMSTASENAMPGDALYGVKRSAERAQLALAGSDVGRGQLYLGFARTRLAEAQAVANDLDRVLADMDRDTSQGVRLLTTAAASQQDRAALDVIDDFAQTQRGALADLSQRVSGADQTRVAHSLALLDAVTDRTGRLRTNLAGECGSPSAASLDSLGPVPQDCVALPPPSALDLGPELTEQPSQPAYPAQPGTAEPDQSGGIGDQPPAAPGGEDPAPAGTTDPAVGDPSGETDTGSSSPDEQEPAPADEDQPADKDGGLLTGLNKLLGDLLGG